MRKLIAKLVNGEITRRDFAARVLGMGFGMMTVESILDTVTIAGESNRSAKNAETFRAEPFSEKTPYEQWIEKEGVPVHAGYFVPNVRTVELKPWKRLGASGAIINLEGAEATDGAYLCEIAPGVATNPQRYMFEESIYVLDGEGETTVWHENRPKQTFKWKKGTLFSPPLNTWRIHKNTSHTPARFISVTDLPLVMDLYHNADFIFNNDFVFRDRYNNQPDYFTVNESKMKIAGSAATFGEGEKGAVGVLDTGLIPDLNQIQLSDRWFHQHFNTGESSAKYMATTWIGGKYWVKGMGGGGRTHRLNTVSFHAGGNMIDYPDEDPMIREMFEADLKKHGVTPRMPEKKG